jgi:hypothetical protein
VLIERERRMRPTGAVARGNPACSLGWAGLAREGKGARSQTHGHGSESRGTASSRSRPAPASLARAHAALSHAPTARLVRRAAPPAEQRALREGCVTVWGWLASSARVRARCSAHKWKGARWLCVCMHSGSCNG